MTLDACPGTFGVDSRVQKITQNVLDRMIQEAPDERPCMYICMYSGVLEIKQRAPSRLF